MSRNPNFDVLVVGGGVIGGAILHALASKGVKAALVERGVIAQGCTAYSGGIVRVFHADSRLTEMAADSYFFYREFEKHTGEHCPLTVTGFLYFPNEAMMSSAQDQVDRLSQRLAMEWLNPDQIRARFPGVCADTDAVYEKGAGYMSPPDVTKAYVRAAKRLGASVYEGTQVSRLIRFQNRFVGAETTQGILFAERTVVALGPNTPQFLARHGIDLPLWAQRIQVDIRRSTAARDNSPAWIDDINDLNGRPYEEDKFLIGYPTHDRNFYDGFVPGSAEHSACIEEFGRRRFHWIDATLRHGSYASFDCYSNGGIGMTDFIDEQHSLAVATGFSGGGFKLAPEVARRIVNKIYS